MKTSKQLVNINRDGRKVKSVQLQPVIGIQSQCPEPRHVTTPTKIGRLDLPQLGSFCTVSWIPLHTGVSRQKKGIALHLCSVDVTEKRKWEAVEVCKKLRLNITLRY